MAKYAESTTVDAARSRAEIERSLQRYGARGFAYAWEDERAMIAFRLHERHIRFILPLPDRQDRTFTHTPTGLRRTERSSAEAYEQAVRQRWRALALVIKAKLEAIESGITTVDAEFLAHLVLPDGRTYGEFALPQIDEVYRSGAMPPLLPGSAAPPLLLDARTGS